MGTLLKASLLVALFLPGVLVAATARAWWPRFSQPWLFVAVGLIALYSLAVHLVTRQFGRIGISGQPASPQEHVYFGLLQVHPITAQALLSLLVFLAVAVVALYLLRYAFSV